ncbi:MAG: formylglycine-generating enzyme family protein [Candidatus Electrothrix sp. AW2]|nr:formylglycine-generating enzyme family protein [Candidatus Electrothrix gigas]
MKIFIMGFLLLAALPTSAQEAPSCYNGIDGPKEVADCLEGKAATINTELRKELKKTNDKLDAALTALEALKEQFEKQLGHNKTIAGIEFVYVPKGCFLMGSDNEEDEKPPHDVCLDAFWMGKYEVTQGQWKAVMGDNPAWFKKGDHYPVESVSWDMVQNFIRMLNRQSGKQFRLPTEAEWEYACRGNDGGEYCGGDDLDALAWYAGNSKDSTQPVGLKRPNGFGLHDMSGNVWEWCADWYKNDYYEDRPIPDNNPQGPSEGPHHVVRGGSWIFIAMGLRSAYRNTAYRNIVEPSFLYRNEGFRLVLPDL